MKIVEDNKARLMLKNLQIIFIFLYISNSGYIICNLYTGMMDNTP